MMGSPVELSYLSSRIRSIATDRAESQSALGCSGSKLLIGLLADLRAATFLGEVPGLPSLVSHHGDDHHVSWRLIDRIELVVRSEGTVALGEDGWKNAYRVRIEKIIFDGESVE